MLKAADIQKQNVTFAKRDLFVKLTPILTSQKVKHEHLS